MNNSINQQSLGLVTRACIALLLGSLATSRGIANEVFNWDDPDGGVYGSFNNWTPLGVPAAPDTARFFLDSDYNVSFFANRQVEKFHLFDGEVTFESSGSGAGDRTYSADTATVDTTSVLRIERGAGGKNLTVFTNDLFRNRGTVDVAGGAELINTDAVVSSLGGSSVAQVRVAGTNQSEVRSLWQATGAVVGDEGDGNVQVEDGGFADINGSLVLGATAGTDGEITVTGRNEDSSRSELSVAGNLTIGDAGTGRLLIRGGAWADSIQSFLGNAAGGRGSVTVEGDAAHGSAFWNAGHLFVARGDVTLNRGGAMRTFDAEVGSGANSSVTVSGQGAVGNPAFWEAQGTTTIGHNFETNLNINQGGIFNGRTLIAGKQVGGLGRISLSSNTPFEQSRLLISSHLYLGGDANGPGGLAELSLFDNSKATVDERITIYAGSSVTLNAASSHLIANEIFNASGGSFNFLSGTLNTQSYTGDLLNQGGVLSPYEDDDDGSGTGFTVIDGDYTQQSGATLAIDINGSLCGISYDHLSVDDFATLGGNLQLNLLNGYAPKPFETFDVLAAELLFGQFDNVAPGERLTTTDGLGSFVVHYGASSQFSPNQVILSDFLAVPDITGDLNLDGIVDGLDLGILLGNFGNNSAPSGGELDGTDPVDGLDLGILLGAWSPPALRAATIPEPTNAALFTLAISILTAAQSGRRTPTVHCIVARARE